MPSDYKTLEVNGYPSEVDSDDGKKLLFKKK